MTVAFLASPYHTSGRGGAKITDIVVHWMAGTLANTDAEFTHGSRRVSAHYGIEDGVVHQYVADADTAWHAGNWGENTRSIGIEHSAQPRRPASPATIATSVALMVTLCRKYGISPDHIYGHSKFYPTQCPGTLPIASMIAAVRAQLATPTPTPEDDMLTPEAQTWIEGRMDAHDAYITQNLRAAIVATKIDPAAVAKAVAAALPTTGAVTQAQLEAALRVVLGSVDGKV